jgi:hypothetical protein
MTEDDRIIRRRRVLKSAKIVFPGGDVVVDCVIRDLSAAGARLEVPATIGVPEEFTLIDTHANRQYIAKTAWRRGTNMGVEFRDPPEEEEDA